MTTNAKRSQSVLSSLMVGGFSRGNDLPPPSDPIMVMPMVLEVRQLKTYDGNVRLVPNPKYDELHLAISTQGPEAAGVLPITRRPGEDLFMIARGGNTRLEIIQKLFTESGDSRFKSVQCLFYPWPGEAKVLADHIAENENRGETTFIEKALALKTLWRKMEQEAGESISLREFVRRLNDPEFRIGLSVSRTQMQRLEYTADFLYPLIPEVLKAGLGPRQVEQIQKLEALFSNYWQRRDGDEVAFGTLFSMVLGEYNTPDFSLEAVRRALEIRFSDMLDRPLHDVQAGIAALENGIEIGDGAGLLDIEAISQRSMPGLVKPSGTAPSPQSAPAQAQVNPQAPSPISRSVATPAVTPTASSEAAKVSSQDSGNALPAWRVHTHQLARQLAERHGLEECVTEASHGLGFFVDLPRFAITDTPATAAIWWLLVGLSEQLVFMEGVNHVSAMPENSELRQRVETNDWNEIYGRVGRNSWMTLPHQLEMSEIETEEFIELFRGLRCLRQQATEPVLWKR